MQIDKLTRLTNQLVTIWKKKLLSISQGFGTETERQLIKFYETLKMTCKFYSLSSGGSHISQLTYLPEAKINK